MKSTLHKGERKRERPYCHSWFSRLLSSEGFELTQEKSFLFRERFLLFPYRDLSTFFHWLSTWSRCEAWLGGIEFRSRRNRLPDEWFFTFFIIFHVQTNISVHSLLIHIEEDEGAWSDVLKCFVGETSIFVNTSNGSMTRATRIH